MTLVELQNSLLFKRESRSSVASEFNELKRNKELLDSVCTRFPFIAPLNIGQLLYHLRDDLPEQKCICGTQRKFNKFDKGYAVTCGNQSCKTVSRFVNLKKNNLEKHGVEHTSQLESTKQKHRKTMLQKYGCEHNFTGSLREKTYSKNLEKYGAKHALQRKDSLEKRNRTVLERHGTLNLLHGEKAKQTNLERYSVENAVKSDIIKKRIKESNSKTKIQKQKKRLTLFNLEILEYFSETQYYSILCKKCDTRQTIAGCTLNNKLRLNMDPCTLCNPHIPSYSSGLENELREWLTGLGEKVLNNVKTLVTNQELDIYLPERGIGIEFNGLYWHSEIFKEELYHQKKTKAFLEKGVRLYHVWEDDWQFKKQKVKSRILNLLHKSNRLSARKCELQEITGTNAKRFFEENHLDETFNAKRYIGALYEGELVSVMSFSKSRFDRSGDWEIIRFASKMGATVIGIASRLIKRFIELESPSRIITYAKVDWTPDHTKSVYSQLGFSLVRITSPGVYWAIDGSRMNRLNFTKKKLVQAGYDPELTAEEIMHADKKYRVYDCGNWKFEILL